MPARRKRPPSEPPAATVTPQSVTESATERAIEPESPAEHVEAGFTIGRTTSLGFTMARWEERLAVFLAVLAIVIFATKTYGSTMNPGSWNDQSRFATIQALVEQGTFAIDNTSLGYWTGDKVFAGEHFYSTKPPLLSVAGAAVYWPMYHLLGWTYFNETQAPTIYYLVTLVLVGLPLAGMAVLFYNTLAEFGLRLRWRLLGVFSFAVGSLYLPYSSIFQNHTVAGIAGLYSFILLLRTSRGQGPVVRNLVLAGLMVGIALATDIVGGAPFAVAAVAWMLARMQHGGGARLAIPLCAAFAVVVAIHFASNIAMLGDWRPIYTKAETYKLTDVKGYFGEVLERKSYFQTLTDPYRWRYIVNSLFGIRGIFLYTPTLLFGFWIGWRLMRTRWEGLLELDEAGRSTLTWWVAGFLGMTLVSFAYLLLRTENYGGTSYGSRYFIPPMSVLLLFGALVYTALGSARARGWYAEALRVSTVMALVGLVHPWGVHLLYGAPTNFSFAGNLQAYGEYLLGILVQRAGY